MSLRMSLRPAWEAAGRPAIGRDARYPWVVGWPLRSSQASYYYFSDAFKVWAGSEWKVCQGEVRYLASK
jgi:hypothetical protein